MAPAASNLYMLDPYMSTLYHYNIKFLSQFAPAGQVIWKFQFWRELNLEPLYLKNYCTLVKQQNKIEVQLFSWGMIYLWKLNKKMSHFRQCSDQRWWIFNPPILRLLHVEYKQNLVGMLLNLICVKCLPLFYMHIMTFQHLLICFLHLSTAPSCIS